jgi:hypothetical protein
MELSPLWYLWLVNATDLYSSIPDMGGARAHRPSPACPCTRPRARRHIAAEAVPHSARWRHGQRGPQEQAVPVLAARDLVGARPHCPPSRLARSARMHACRGFSPIARHWRAFQQWFRTRPRSFKPTIPGGCPFRGARRSDVGGAVRRPGDHGLVRGVHAHGLRVVNVGGLVSAPARPPPVRPAVTARLQVHQVLGRGAHFHAVPEHCRPRDAVCALEVGQMTFFGVYAPPHSAAAAGSRAYTTARPTGLTSLRRAAGRRTGAPRARASGRAGWAGLVCGRAGGT